MNNKSSNSNDFLEGIKTKKNPFKTPENYFDNLSEDLLLQQKLKTSTRKTGYIVPKDYFKTFSVQKPTSKIRKLIPYFSVAAAILIGFFLFETNNEFEELNNTEVINYLALEEEIDLIDILDYSSDEQVYFTTSNINSLNPTIDELSLELSEFDIINF